MDRRALNDAYPMEVYSVNRRYNEEFIMEDLSKARNLDPEAIQEMRQRFKEAESQMDNILKKLHSAEAEKAVAISGKNKGKR